MPALRELMVALELELLIPCWAHLGHVFAQQVPKCVDIGLSNEWRARRRDTV